MAMITWVVRPGDGATVADIVEKAGGDARAVEEGRVFVGTVRATCADVAVVPGDEVRIAPHVQNARDSIAILARTSDLLVVVKPAGIPTIPDHGGVSHALLARAAHAAAIDQAKLHATSRLDRDVSGVVVFALSDDARARLQQARERGAYVRRYVALAMRAPDPSSGTWNAPIGRAKDPRHRAPFGRDATHAETAYRVVAVASEVALLAVAPRTGRTHQIRVHASHAGASLLGDRVYGGPPRIAVREGAKAGRVLTFRRIALHAARVVVPRDADSLLDARADVPEDLRQIWAALGGDASAWDTAVSCDVP